MANSTVLAFHFFFCLLYLIMESELDLERVKGESPLLELFLAQMMSVMCCATRVMATVLSAPLGMMTSANFFVGRQNSSKAGLTRLVYCCKMCSRSLPLS